MRRLRRLLFLCSAAYAIIVLLAAFGQRWLLYPRAPFNGLPVDGARWSVPFPGGEVPLWFMRNDDAPDAPLVVWFHGNAEQLSNTTGPAWAFRRRGLNFAAVEYPDYGAAKGVGPTEETVLAAVRASLDTLAPSGLPIVCVGASLGTGPAAAMAAEGRCERLALVSAYSSLPEAAQAVYPFLPGKWLVQDRFDTLDRAPSIAVPTLLVHGRNDRTCPYWMGLAIAGDLPNARLLDYPRGHNDILYDEVLDELAAFAKEASRLVPSDTPPDVEALPLPPSP